MQKIYAALCGLAVFSFLALAGHNACAEGYDGPKLKFRVAHTTPPGNHITLAFEKFKELVATEKSKSRFSPMPFSGRIACLWKEPRKAAWKWP